MFSPGNRVYCRDGKNARPRPPESRSKKTGGIPGSRAARLAWEFDQHEEWKVQQRVNWAQNLLARSLMSCYQRRLKAQRSAPAKSPGYIMKCRRAFIRYLLRCEKRGKCPKYVPSWYSVQGVEIFEGEKCAFV